MMSIGRVCVKIAGRDAGMKGVIIDTIDQNNVLVDGQLRRKKCNIKHLEPTTTVLELEKGAPHDEVKEALKSIGIEVRDHVKKEKPLKEENVAEEAKKTKTEKTVKKR